MLHDVHGVYCCNEVELVVFMLSMLIDVVAIP